MINIYEGFEDWNDVLKQFHDFGYGKDSEKLIDAFLAQNPEPEVFLADYYTGSYEGDALVVFKKDGKFYIVEGSHCSCYGLEGQWSPEEYDPETFRQVVQRKLDAYREDYGGYGAHTKQNWQKIKDKLEAIS